jgi:hypothetical protein
MDREEMRRRLTDLRKRQAAESAPMRLRQVGIRIGNGQMQWFGPVEAEEEVEKAKMSGGNWDVFWEYEGGNDGQRER